MTENIPQNFSARLAATTADNAMHALAQTISDQTHSIRTYMAKNDASLVLRACAGIGTDEELLQGVICSRNKTQLAAIDHVLHDKAGGKSIMSIVRGEVSGNFGSLLKYALMSEDEFHAHIMSSAVGGIGTTESLINELFGTLSTAQIHAMRTKWEARNNANLTDCISGELSGDYEVVILHLLNTGRNGTNDADHGNASNVATALHEAGVGNHFGTDEQSFVTTFCSNSIPQLTAVNHAYEAAYGMSLHTAIDKEFSGDAAKCLTMLMSSAIDNYCIIIFNACKGIGTDEKAVARVIGGHDTATLKLIATRYQERYSRKLVEVLDSELNGNFKTAAINLVLSALEEGPYGTCDKDSHGLSGNALKAHIELLIAENAFLRTQLARTDALAILRACSGVGTNEEAVLDVVCKRTKYQLGCVKHEMRTHYDKHLRELLNSEIGGNCGQFLGFLTFSERDFTVMMLNESFSGAGTNEALLIEMLCTRTPADLEAIRARYQEVYHESLTDRLTNEVNGDLKTLLNQVMHATTRNMTATMGDDEDDKMAKKLYKAGAGKRFGTDDEVFFEVFCANGPLRLNKMGETYAKNHGEGLRKVIADEFGGDVEIALQALMTAPLEYFVNKLHAAFEGMGTDEAAVNRIIGGFSRQDVASFAQRYHQKFDEVLVDRLNSELSGIHQQAVRLWVTAHDPTHGSEESMPQTAEDNDDDAFARAGADVSASDVDADEHKYVPKAQAAAAVPPPVVVPPPMPEPVPVVISHASGAHAEAEAIRLMAALEVKDNDDDDDGDDDDDDGDGDGGGDDDDPEGAAMGRARRKTVARQRKQARMRDKKQQKQLGQAKARAQQEAANEQRRAEVNNRAEFRAGKLREYLGNFGKPALPAERVVSGNWSYEAYNIANHISEDAWGHFQRVGYDNGCLVGVKTPMGTFVGALSLELTLNANFIELPNRAAYPFHPYEKLRNNFALKSFDEVRNMTIVLSPAIPVTMIGQFKPGLYFQNNAAARPYACRPKAEKPDIRKYQQRYPDAAGADKPVKHMCNHMFKAGVEIYVAGRWGNLSKVWYRRQYNCPRAKQNALRAYKQANWNNALKLKVVGHSMSAADHYRKYGHDENLRVTIVNQMGVFSGVFDDAGYNSHTGNNGNAWHSFSSQVLADNAAFYIKDVMVVAFFATGNAETPTADVPMPDNGADDDDDDGDGGDDDGDDDDGDDDDN